MLDKFFLMALTLLICVTQFNELSAQTIPSDLSNVQVDDLTDTQVQEFSNKVAESGLSQGQLEIMARSRGMSAGEIRKLRTRIENLSRNSEENAKQDINRLREENMSAKAPGTTVFSGLDIKGEQQGGRKIFGMDLFSNKNLTFEPSLNIPTPKDYVLGPGDELLIDIWGASEQTYQLQLNPEGYIRVPNLGPIYVSGLSIERATIRIKNRLTKIYAGISPVAGNEPTTYAQVSLGSLRSIKVNVIGEVRQPGTYTLSSLATVFNALYFSGGPTSNGSLRKIEIFRNGKAISELDIYEYLVHGKHGTNVRLRSEDVIIVSPYQKRITLSGQVKRPGIYESKGDETLADFLFFAGGFNEKSYQSSVKIIRNNKTEKSVKVIQQDEFDTFVLNSGDKIEIGSILNRYSNRVRIEGAVYREGVFELTNGLTLKNLISLADGLTGDAFLGRGILLRTEDDLSLNAIEFNVEQLMSGGADDIPLQKEDFVIINSIHDLQDEQFIQIEGQVSNPGKFPFASNMTLEDLIYLAGGLKESASGSNIEIARRSDRSNEDLTVSADISIFEINVDLSSSTELSEFVLSPFDLVLIRRAPGYNEQALIDIEGEVLYPGKYTISKKNERISDVLKRSGGLTQFAYAKGATLIRKTEFFAGGETGRADKIRKESLESLGERDVTTPKLDIKKRESIGIELGEILTNPGSKHDLILKEGDVLSIPKETQTIRLRGELLYPATVRFDKLHSFKDYISLAGGFSDDSRPGKSYVIYANGSAARTKRFLWFKNYPKIEAGAEVIVPKRPDRKRISIQEILAITTSLTTIALLIQQLR